MMSSNRAIGCAGCWGSFVSVARQLKPDSVAQVSSATVKSSPVTG